MSRMSVAEAAVRLGVSPARVRQRIDEGSLVAAKVGGRWLVDLDASGSSTSPRGRPVAPASVWWSLLATELARPIMGAWLRAALPTVDAEAFKRAVLPAVDAEALKKALLPALRGEAFKRALMPSANPEALTRALIPSLQDEAFKRAIMPALNVEAFKRAVMPAVDAEAFKRAVMPAVDAEAFKRAVMSAADEDVVTEASRGVDIVDQSSQASPANDQSHPLLSRMRAAEAALSEADELYLRNAAEERHLAFAGITIEAKSLSPSSRQRAIRRLADAVEQHDHAALLSWLRNRASRHVYVAADSDLEPLRADQRILLSGLSHPDSNMEDPRVVEGYVEARNLQAVVDEHWLESPSIDERPNVVLHAGPVQPPAVSRLMLAADLAEHGGPREMLRAHELLDAEIRELLDGVTDT
ncbi:helix-turn-helix domain-containing protein [Nocardioides sp.]|uniref:helix-turn-helix domain-containing protein n=1 Tax=Nocardioides sp. TaxID=35761 RepID=UPI002ED82064